MRSLLNVPLEKVGRKVHKVHRRIVNTQRYDTTKPFLIRSNLNML